MLACEDGICLHYYYPLIVVFKLGVYDCTAVYGFVFAVNLIALAIIGLSSNSICPLFDKTLMFDEDALCAFSLADLLICTSFRVLSK